MNGLRALLRLLVKGRPEGLRRRLLRRLRGRGPTDRPEAQTPEPSLDPALGAVIAEVDDLRDGEVLEVMLEGRPVAICRVAGTIHAVEGTCPHAGGPLADGVLEGTVLTCPYHGWAFDVVTGECLMDDELKVDRVEIEIVEGKVRVPR